MFFLIANRETERKSLKIKLFQSFSFGKTHKFKKKKSRNVDDHDEIICKKKLKQMIFTNFLIK